MIERFVILCLKRFDVFLKILILSGCLLRLSSQLRQLRTEIVKLWTKLDRRIARMPRAGRLVGLISNFGLKSFVPLLVLCELVFHTSEHLLGAAGRTLVKAEAIEAMHALTLSHTERLSDALSPAADAFPAVHLAPPARWMRLNRQHFVASAPQPAC